MPNQSFFSRTFPGNMNCSRMHNQGVPSAQVPTAKNSSTRSSCSEKRQKKRLNNKAYDQGLVHLVIDCPESHDCTTTFKDWEKLGTRWQFLRKKKKAGIGTCMTKAKISVRIVTRSGSRRMAWSGLQTTRRSFVLKYAQPPSKQLLSHYKTLAHRWANTTWRKARFRTLKSIWRRGMMNFIWCFLVKRFLATSSSARWKATERNRGESHGSVEHGTWIHSF